jgi:peptidoglycan/LPS O-acetylase OafA/YrhL|tara:strand:- start:150 stop:1148 length:999 start_codon:yes stop_codon:yes gene_type:complete
MLKTKYFYSLDFFRGICGYGVATTHFCAFAFNNLYMEYVSFLFVEFFFVLSGFVLYPQLLKVLNNNKKLFIFYKRRWFRTLPLYLVTLILVSALTNQLFSSDFYKYLFLMQKLLPQFIDNDYFPVAWSLSVEEIFYIFFPLILINLKKNNFINIILSIFILILISKYYLAVITDSNFYRTGSLLRLDAILLGFILAHFKSIFFKFKKIVFFFCFLLLIYYLSNYNLFIEDKDKTSIKVIFIFLMQIISALILFVFLYFEKFIKSNSFKKFCLLISQQTYSIYLTHIIYIYILKKIGLSFYFSISLYTLLLFITSFLIYNFFEKPILKLRPKI